MCHRLTDTGRILSSENSIKRMTRWIYYEPLNWTEQKIEFRRFRDFLRLPSETNERKICTGYYRI